jgi:hypothetical protein
MWSTPLQELKMPKTAETIAVDNAVKELADGYTSSVEIAEKLGVNPRRVRKILKRLNLPRLPGHSPTGSRNAAFAGGRRVDLDGYAIVTAPAGHPHAAYLKGKNLGRIREHRLVMEQKLGRYLRPEEVVDHIDGLTLHNAPDNLRVFASNGEHLRETRSGKTPNWSAAGYASLLLKPDQREGLSPVDTHRPRKEAGVLRLHQTLLAALKLGIDSPYLLGTSRHTTKAGIDMSSRSTIERALADLCQQWGLPHTPS